MSVMNMYFPHNMTFTHILIALKHTQICYFGTANIMLYTVFKFMSYIWAEKANKNDYKQA